MQTNQKEPRVVPATASNLRNVLARFQESTTKALFDAAPADAELTASEQAELKALVNRAWAHLDSLEESESDLDASPEDEVAARLQSWLSDNAENRARIEGLTDEVQFDERDLRWGLSLLSWLRGINKHPIKRPSGSPETLPDTARIAIAGDWGSGLYAAPDIGRTIAAGGYDLALHLGDVYYAGTEQEVTHRFLKFWPKPPDVRVSRALNSNHEMYSGGHGYFKLTLPLLEQSSSYFAMRNDHFLLVGLDTGYKDADLDDAQLLWVKETVEEAGARKVLFFSHHQPFKPGKDGVTRVADRLAPLLNAGKVFAWYWGHEHAAVIFEPHPQWKMHGRCIGHGGFPYFRYKGREALQSGMNGSQWRTLEGKGQTPTARLLDDPNPYVAGKANPNAYGAQGFASLVLDGPRLLERLHRPDGQVIFENQLL